jgi:hypothetical protein
VPAVFLDVESAERLGDDLFVVPEVGTTEIATTGTDSTGTDSTSADSTKAASTEAGGTEKRSHWIRWAASGLVLALVCSGAYLAVRYSFRVHPGAESIGAAVKRLGGADPYSAVSGVSYQPPRSGVYALQGQGTERISFPPNSQTDGRTMPGSVQRLSGGCWRWSVDYNTAHSENYVFCPVAIGNLLSTNGNSQAWDFGMAKVTNVASFQCPARTLLLPGSIEVGKQLRWSCTGRNTSVAGTTVATTTARIVSLGSLEIGGTRVPVVHESQTTGLAGSQKGTVLEQWWFDASSGLPVRMVRNITVHTASPIGTITYTESGSWQMTSLSPRT